MAEEVTDLIKKAMALPVEARMALLSSLRDSLDNQTENDWVIKHREKAQSGLSGAGRVGFMEASFLVIDDLMAKSQTELVQAAESASIHAFGWPIGVVLHTEKGRPRPMSEGIVAEINGIDSSYDYWALRMNGDFYFLASLFEDERTQDAIWFDTRIVRTTETFLFCYRLYKALGVPEENTITITLRHGGLSGRILSSAKPGLWPGKRTSYEAEVEWRRTITLASLRLDLREIVKAALDPLFILFDFFQPSPQQVYSEIDNFLDTVIRQQQLFDV